MSKSIDELSTDEILAYLEDRLQGKQAKVASRRIAIVLTKIQEAILWNNSSY